MNKDYILNATETTMSNNNNHQQEPHNIYNIDSTKQDIVKDHYVTYIRDKENNVQ